MANEVTPQKPSRPVGAPVQANGTAAPVRPAVVTGKKKPGSSAGIVAMLVLAVLIAGAWAAYHFLYQPNSGAATAAAAGGKGGHHGRGGAGDKIRVVPATAARGNLGVYLVGLGAVTPYNTVTVQARVSGQLMKVNFTDGQTVHAGDHLVQIDDRPYRAQLEQYKAQKEHDQALLDNANVDLVRYQTLFRQNSVQQQTLDTQVATVKQDQGTVDADQALIDQTQLNVDYCDIQAPIGGVVGLRLVDVGNQVIANQSNLLIVNQIQPIYVDFTIAEDDVPSVTAKLKAGAKLPVAALSRDLKTKLAEGVLLTTDNQIDPQTGTLKLRASFDNQDNSLFPNQFVNAKLLLETKKNVVIVPVAAIQYGTGSRTFVYTINDDDPKNASVSQKTVTVGTIDGDRAEVKTGLDDGEKVVVDGVDKLADKTKVIVGPPDTGGDDGGSTASTVPSS